LRGHTFSEKLPKIPLFGTYLRNSSVRDFWISAMCSPFNFIFNLGNRKYADKDKYGRNEKKRKKRVVTFFLVQNWRILAALWAGALSCSKKKSREQNAAGRTRRMRFRRRSITPL
jgi:hypothetical protein